jgi:hypothetical protein
MAKRKAPMCKTASMEPEEFWVYHMAEIEKDIEGAQQGVYPPSQLPLHRGRQFQAAKQLHAIRAEQARLAEEATKDVADDASPEEVIESMAASLLELPPDMLRRILDRAGGSGLRVISG